MTEGGFGSRRMPQRRGRNRDRPQMVEEPIEQSRSPHKNSFKDPSRSSSQYRNKFDEIPVGKSKKPQFIPEFPGDIPPDQKNSRRQKFADEDRYSDDEQPITGQNEENDFNDHFEEQMANEGTGGKVKKEKFSKKQISEMKDLSSEISMDVLEQVYSSNWHTREIGLEILLQEIDDLNSNETSLPTKVLLNSKFSSVLQTLWKLNNIFLEERISQLVYKAIMMMSKLILACIDKSSVKSADLGRLIDKTMIKIMEKLGDYKNLNLKDKLTQLLCDMVEGDFMTFEEMAEWLMKEKKLPRGMNGFKHIIGKSMALREISIRFEGDIYPIHRALLGNCCKALENSNKDVRQSASDFIIEIYRIVGGPKVYKYLNNTNIRKNHYENLKKRFVKVDKESKVVSSRNISLQNSQKMSMKKSHNESANESHFAKENMNNKNETASQKKSDVVPAPKEDKLKAKACNFCKKESPSFQIDNDYDMHLWRDCPMLVTCEECTQVVEIAEFTEHLLDECSNNQNYEECERCKLAIPIGEYDAHIDDMVCEKATEELIFCPLCNEGLVIHNDDLEKTWFQHLILQVCPKNRRMI